MNSKLPNGTPNRQPVATAQRASPRFLGKKIAVVMVIQVGGHYLFMSYAKAMLPTFLGRSERKFDLMNDNVPG